MRLALAGGNSPRRAPGIVLLAPLRLHIVYASLRLATQRVCFRRGRWTSGSAIALACRRSESIQKRRCTIVRKKIHRMRPYATFLARPLCSLPFTLRAARRRTAASATIAWPTGGQHLKPRKRPCAWASKSMARSRSSRQDGDPKDGHSSRQRSDGYSVVGRTSRWTSISSAALPTPVRPSLHAVHATRRP